MDSYNTRRDVIEWWIKFMEIKLTEWFDGW